MNRKKKLVPWTCLELETGNTYTHKEGTAMKKINSVEIRRIADVDSDASYLGKYTDTYNTDYIDVRHGEFVSDLLKPTPGCKLCEEATQDSDEPTQCRDCEYDPPTRGRYLRWFVPAQHWPHKPEEWKHVSAADIEKVVAEHGSLEAADKHYAMRDFERMQALERGDWVYVGLVAVAHVTVEGVCQKLQSGGLWGIESDSSANYFKEVAAEELEQLREVLEGVGFTTQQIDAAFRDVKEVDCD